MLSVVCCLFAVLAVLAPALLARVLAEILRAAVLARANNREISTPQDVRNSVMPLFWSVWELHWELYWREEAAGGEFFFGQEARGKEIARRKKISDALKREERANAPLFQSPEF